MSSLIALATDERALDHAHQALDLPEAALHPEVGAKDTPFIENMPRLLQFGDRAVIDQRLYDVAARVVSRHLSHTARGPHQRLAEPSHGPGVRP